MEGTCSQSDAPRQDNQVAVLWNQQIITDRTKPCNKPDIILRDRKRTCLLIDVSIPSDKNVQKSETEKEIKAHIYRLNHRACAKCTAGDTVKQGTDVNTIKIIIVSTVTPRTCTGEVPGSNLCPYNSLYRCLIFVNLLRPSHRMARDYIETVTIAYLSILLNSTIVH